MVYELKDWQILLHKKGNGGSSRREEKIPQANWIAGVRDTISCSYTKAPVIRKLGGKLGLKPFLHKWIICMRHLLTFSHVEAIMLCHYYPCMEILGLISSDL
jgi:hypothetical protein